MRTVIFYTIPATGHVFAMLAVMKCLVEQGDNVVVYSSNQYSQMIQGTGARVVLYDMDDNDINLKDGSRILKFYALVLQYTVMMIDQLLLDARELKADLIIYDAPAHWGKRVGESLHIPAVSFCSFVAANSKFGVVTLAYFCNFFKSSIQDFKQLFVAKQYIKILENKYSYSKFSISDVLLGKGKLNVISYSKQLQTGKRFFDDSYFFLGPTATMRDYGASDDIIFDKDKTNIYLSLGTISNDNAAFYNQIINVLEASEYNVYVSAKSGTVSCQNKGQFMVRSFFNQRDMLDGVDLFMTAGGCNSVNEAIKSGTPCLMFPQQGEQKILCKKVQALGFGKIGSLKKDLKLQIEQALGLKKSWNTQLSQAMTVVKMQELMERLNDM